MAGKNLLFITADQWRGECLSTLGHIVQTPNLDRLAADGTTFTNNFAVAAPCGPSRASIHTGTYVHTNRVCTNGNPLSSRLSTWASELRGAGHDPVLFGYTDTVVDPGPAGTDEAPSEVLPGIRQEVYLGKEVWAPYSWAEWLKGKGLELPEQLWDLYAADESQPEWEDGGPSPRPLKLSADLHDTKFMVDRVLDYLDDRRDGGWCVHLSLLRPHPPWTAPEPYNTLYPPEHLGDFVRGPAEIDPDHMHPFMRFAQSNPHMAGTDDRAMMRMKASYFGLMTEVDSQLGRIFDALRAAGSWDDTLVIFTSDHGEQIGDHHLIGKLGYYDQSFSVPLIIRNPDRAADAHRGLKVDRMTEGIDLAPTILDWFELDIPPQFSGRSLVPATADGALPPDWRNEAHWEFDFSYLGGEKALGLTQEECRLTVVRGPDYKYVFFPTLQPILFDLSDDPDELIDRAGEPAHRERELRAAEELLRWRTLSEDRAFTHLTWTQGKKWIDRRVG